VVGGLVPRGTVMGCHVVPLYWLLVCLLKCIGVRWGSTPGPPHRIAPSQSLSDQWTIIYALIYIWIDIYLNSNYVINDGGSGRGLAPTRNHIIITCDHICIHHEGVVMGIAPTSVEWRGIYV
jgi:hypothetical protein